MNLVGKFDIIGTGLDTSENGTYTRLGPWLICVLSFKCDSCG